MPIKELDRLKKSKKVWDTFIDSMKERLEPELSELEISALYTCIEDSSESFEEIYNELLPALQSAFAESDFDRMETIVIEMKSAFDHIERHIQDASKGFFELPRQLEKMDKP